MILTAEDMYRYFLDGIKKESTSVVVPDAFNRYINEWGQIPWVRNKLSILEFNEKVIDDLAPISKEEILTVTPQNTADLSQLLFPMLRQRSLMVKVLYDPAYDCATGTSGWLPMQLMRSDKKSFLMHSKYGEPTPSRIYYRRFDTVIEIDCGLMATPLELLVEYYMRPGLITYHPTTPINPIWGPLQNMEICDWAVRTYLERISDPRYKSFLTEESIKGQGNM